MTMTLVETITVGSGGAASIEFTGIPQTGKDLLIVLSYRSSFSDTVRTLNIYPNGDTTGVSTILLEGLGSSVQSFSGGDSFGRVNGSTSTANTFSSTTGYFSNYTSGSAKSFTVDAVTENNATSANAGIVAGLWNKTSPITSLKFDAATTLEHTTASLYIIS